MPDRAQVGWVVGLVGLFCGSVTGRAERASSSPSVSVLGVEPARRGEFRGRKDNGYPLASAHAGDQSRAPAAAFYARGPGGAMSVNRDALPHVQVETLPPQHRSTFRAVVAVGGTEDG